MIVSAAGATTEHLKFRSPRRMRGIDETMSVDDDDDAIVDGRWLDERMVSSAARLMQCSWSNRFTS